MHHSVNVVINYFTYLFTYIPLNLCWQGFCIHRYLYPFQKSVKSQLWVDAGVMSPLLPGKISRKTVIIQGAYINLDKGERNDDPIHLIHKWPPTWEESATKHGIEASGIKICCRANSGQLTGQLTLKSSVI